MKQSFMAMVSHDLRTPVSANLLTLDLLKSDSAIGNLTDRGRTLVERSIASNNRLMFLINDLLELERLDSGQLTLDMELVTFNDLIDETLPGVEMLAKAKDIAIEKDDSDRFIYCESARIVQVLVNLIGNAVKFSPSGKKVFLKYAEGGGYSRISVSDEGPGINKDSISSIFDKFTQVKEASGAHKQGFGLGLEICKKLVELHGGSITVSSELGVGTTFEISLPLKDV
jgi:signal transduction histidine kinase